MKKILILTLILVLTGCNAPTSTEDNATSKKEVSDFQESQNQIIEDKDIDIDLTKLSATMIYGEVYNMINNPKEYEGKTIKIQGQYNLYQDLQTTMHLAIIEDATECCQQGLEFLLKSEFDYPPLDTEISIVGEFEIYEEIEEYNLYYYRLKDAIYSE